MAIKLDLYCMVDTIGTWKGQLGGLKTGSAFNRSTNPGHMVKVLLDVGAMMEAQNHSKCRAPERAAANGREEVVLLPLVIGVEVNKQTGKTGKALYGSAVKGSRAILKVLLDHNAEVNAQGGEYGNALQAAAYKGK